MLASVVIPCFNVEDYLEECLDSALAQTYRPIEIIAVDNNSTDRTREILMQYREKHPEIIQIVEEVKQGAPAARNRGLHLAMGEWVQFLDADDLILPDKIAGQMKVINRKKKCSIILSPICEVDLNEKYHKRAFENEDLWIGLIEGRLGTTSSWLWEKEEVLQAGGWVESLTCNQEYELLFRILTNGGTVSFNQDRHTFIRERPYGAISQKTKKSYPAISIDLRIRIRDFLKSEGMYNDERKAIMENYLFKMFRMLYLYHPKESLELYTQIMPGSFVPAKGVFPGYHLAFKILGFKGTERLIAFARRVRALF